MRSRPSTPFDVVTFLATAGPHRSIAKYGGGSVIFAQGDPAEDIFYIRDGQVKITVVSRRGKEAVVGILTPGQFFGEAALNGQRMRISTATAIGDSSIIRLTRLEMLDILCRNPEFSNFFIHHLLVRNVRIEEDLVDQLFNSSEKRLARTLLLLARYGEPEASHRTLPKVSQETLAEMVGTTRSRVNFFMNKFRKLGFIEYNGGLKINNSLLSVVLRD